MEIRQKESYTEPVLMVHELLLDITGVTSRKAIEKPGTPEG